MNPKDFRVALLTTSLIFATSCATQPAENAGNNPFTSGNVTLNLKTGVTTQADVLRVFGAPNIATVDSSGMEVWSYQKNATISSSSSSQGFFTIVLASAATSQTQFATSSRTMTLIIKFNAQKIVTDFSSFASSF